MRCGHSPSLASRISLSFCACMALMEPERSLFLQRYSGRAGGRGEESFHSIRRLGKPERHQAVQHTLVSQHTRVHGRAAFHGKAFMPLGSFPRVRLKNRNGIAGHGCKRTPMACPSSLTHIPGTVQLCTRRMHTHTHKTLFVDPGTPRLRVFECLLGVIFSFSFFGGCE